VLVLTFLTFLTVAKCEVHCVLDHFCSSLLLSQLLESLFVGFLERSAMKRDSWGMSHSSGFTSSSSGST